MKISCLIPAYNEANNIECVLKAAKDVKIFNEVIVIDDGSKDDTARVVRTFQRNFRKLKLLVNYHNLGKTGAIMRGVDAASGDLIVMLDADLINLTSENVQSLIGPLLRKEYDLTILDRAGDRKAAWGWTDCARFFGGERALWKEDFKRLRFPAAGGYLLEICMNLQFMRSNKIIKTIYCPNLYTFHHYNKEGFLEGYKHYLQMGTKIVRTSKVSGFLKQIYKIEEDRLSWLYKYHQRDLLKPITIILIPIGCLIWGFSTFILLNVSDIPIPRRLLRIRKSVKRKTRELKKNAKIYLKKSKEILNNYQLIKR